MKKSTSIGKNTNKAGLPARKGLSRRTKNTDDNGVNNPNTIVINSMTPYYKAAYLITGDEPSSDRGTSVTEQDVEISWLAALAAVLELVIVAYSLIGKPQDPVPQSLDKVMSVIDVVQARISNVQQRIDLLMVQISQLEERIRGVIRKELLEGALSQVHSKSLTLSSLMRDESTLKAELPRVVRLMDELQDQLFYIRAWSNGLYAGAFSMAPGISLWIQTYMAVQRVRAVLPNPPVTPKTVWDEPFHLENMKMFNEVFRLNDELESQYNRELASMPINLKVYEFRLNPDRFELSTVPFKTGYAPGEGRGNLFTLGRGLQPASFGDALFSTYPSPTGQGRWVWGAVGFVPPFNFPDEATVVAADAYNNYRIQRKNLIRNHFSIMKNAPYYKEQFRIYCETKPADWGGTGQLPISALVHLTNDRWDAVNVEVRRGREQDCANNAAFETRQLERSELWTIPAPDVDVCYRRDVDPNNPNGQWTSWRRVTVNNDGEYWESIR